MKTPLVVGQESATPLDKSTGMKNVHSCLKNVGSDADDSPFTRRKIRSVSFSFQGENGKRPMDDDQRDPPDEQARQMQDFWDDTEYSVSIGSNHDMTHDRKNDEWIPISSSIKSRCLCNKMLCGGGDVDTAIYNEGPLKDLDLEPLDYDSLFFKEEDENFSLSAKSGSTSTRKKVQVNELSATLSDDTDISLNANSVHVDSIFNDSLDSDSISISSQRCREEEWLRLPNTLRQINIETPTDNKLSITSGTPSQMDRQFQNLQEDTSRSTDSSLEKPDQTLQEDPTQSTDSSSLDAPHQTLQEDSNSIFLETSVSSETPEYETGEESLGVEWTLQEFRESTMSVLSGCSDVPPPKPKEEQQVESSAEPQGSSPSSRPKSMTRKLLGFRRSRQQQGGKQQDDKIQPSSPLTASPQEDSPVQDATSTNRQEQNHESQVLSSKPLDTETLWKESIPAATPLIEPDSDITDKARQEIQDDVDPLDEIEHTSSPTGCIPNMTEKNDVASEQDDSGSEWSPHSVCCSMMLTPPVNNDDLSVHKEYQENHQQDEQPSELTKKCQEGKGDEQQSSDPAQPINDQEDDTNILNKVSTPLLSGFCCPDSHTKEEEDGPFLDGTSQASQSYTLSMPSESSCKQQQSIMSMPSLSSCDQQQDQRGDEAHELNDVNVRGCSSVSEEKEDARCIDWNVPILELIMAWISPVTSSDLSSSQRQGDQGGDTLQRFNPVSVKGCVPDVQNEKYCGSTEWTCSPLATLKSKEDGCDFSEPQQEGDQRGEMIRWLSQVSVKGCVPDIQNEKDCGSTEWTCNALSTTSMATEDVCDLPEPQQEGDQLGDMMQWLSHVSVKGCVSDVQNEKYCDTLQWSKSVSAKGSIPDVQNEKDCDSTKWTCNPLSTVKPTEDVCGLSEPQQQGEDKRGSILQWLNTLNLHACNPLSEEKEDGDCAKRTTQGFEPIIYFLPTVNGTASATKTPLVLSSPCSPTERAQQEDDIKVRDKFTLSSPFRRRSCIAKMTRRKISQRRGDVERKVKSVVKMFDRSHQQRQDHVCSTAQSEKRREWKTDKQKRQSQRSQVSGKSLSTDIPPAGYTDTTTPTPTPTASYSDPTYIARKTSDEDDKSLLVETTSLLPSLTGWSLPNMIGQESSQHENGNGGRVKALVEMFDHYNLTMPPLHRGDYILHVKRVDRQLQQQKQQGQDNQETPRGNSHGGSPSSTIGRENSEGQESQVSGVWSLPIWRVPYSDETHQKEEEHEKEEDDDDEHVHELDKIAAAAPSLSSVHEEVSSSRRLSPSWMMSGAVGFQTGAQGRQQQDDSISIAYAYDTLRDLVTSTMTSFDQLIPQQSKQKEKDDVMMDQRMSNRELLSTPETLPESSSLLSLTSSLRTPCDVTMVSNNDDDDDDDDLTKSKCRHRSGRFLGVVGSRRLFGRKKKKQQQQQQALGP